MSIHFKNYYVIVTACISLAGVESSPAQSDELPGDVMRGDAAAAKTVDPATSGTTSDDTPPRQHVKHLIAHKKLSLDTPTDLTQPTDKSERAQSSGAKRVSDDAGGKVVADGGAALNTTKAIAKPGSAKIIRARREVNENAQPAPNTGARAVQQRDFLSDIFGPDD